MHDEPPGAGANAIARALGFDHPSDQLAALDDAEGGAIEWARELRRQAYARFWPVAAQADFARLLAELGQLARAFGAVELLRRLEGLAVALERPLTVAVVGEFNAGKSSFVNALLGEEVAPVGVLPTTATVNRLAWATDRFARIERRAVAGSTDRVVMHSELRGALAELDPQTIEQVTLYAPLELLRRIEIVDTPGFNAPAAGHAALARRAFADVHAALWLLDATQPLKESERAILVEIASLEIPLVVLLNKRDRLVSEADVVAVVAHVKRALDEVLVPVLSAPIAFSAKLALAEPREGGAATPAHFEEVERLVERVLVDRSAALREQALRRKVRVLVAEIGVFAAARAAERSQIERERADRAGVLRAAARRVQAERASFEEHLQRELEALLGDLDRDLRPVGAELDTAAERFVSARTRALVGTPLAERALQWCGVSETELRSELTARVEALAGLSAPWLRDTRMSRAVGNRLVGCVGNELCNMLETGATELPPQRVPPAEARLQALAEIVGPPPSGARIAIRDDVYETNRKDEN
jgi:GTP-binding protein EngB required for normal cell division